MCDPLCLIARYAAMSACLGMGALCVLYVGNIVTGIVTDVRRGLWHADRRKSDLTWVAALTCGFSFFAYLYFLVAAF